VDNDAKQNKYKKTVKKGVNEQKLANTGEIRFVHYSELCDNATSGK
jgi:hypothetical protein